MYLPSGDRRMVVTPQLALRVAILGGDRAGAVRDRLLPALVPPGPVRRQVPRRGERQPRARGEGRGAARARSSTATAPCWSTTARRSPCRCCPSSCRSDRAQARARDAAPRARARIASRRPCARKIRQRRARAAVQPGDAQDRRRARRPSSTCRRTRRASRASTSSGSSCASTPTTTIGAHLFGTLGEVTEKQLKQSRYAASTLGDRVGQSGIEYAVRPLPARPQRRQPDPGRRARPPEGRAVGARPDARASSCGCRSTSACRRRARQALERYGKPGGVRGDGPAQRRGARPRQQPELRPERVRQGRSGVGLQAAAATPTTARRSPTARPRASTRRARRSS